MISVIVPAYNEEKQIGKTIEKLLKEKVEEIIVVVDGNDKTGEIAKKYKKVKVLTFKHRLGKGGAIKEGFKASKGDVIVFVDADYWHQKASIRSLAKWIPKYDIAIGSRRKRKTIKRKILSWGFNLLTKILLGLNLRDTQCGFKAFKREALKDLLSKMKTRGYAFDVELLYLAKNKYKIKEVPVEWEDINTKINPVKDSLKMFLELLRIKAGK
ncbi:MAG: glycosyltransferase [Nanoarchaeota archaeon]|nr:glycosyltransferase [Nanoarchaeota archaeon]